MMHIIWIIAFTFVLSVDTIKVLEGVALSGFGIFLSVLCLICLIIEIRELMDRIK